VSFFADLGPRGLLEGTFTRGISLLPVSPHRSIAEIARKAAFESPLLSHE